jgi:beta-N-acetylhexosaminidase
VGALRRWLGSFSRPDLDVVGCSEHALLAAEVARQSVTLVRDEDDLLPLRPRGRLLAVMPRPSDLTPADTSSTVPPLLAGALRRHHPHVTEVVTEPVPTAADIAGVRAAVERADMAVIGTITAGTEQATLVKSVLDCSKPTVTVALRTPFDLAAYPAAAVHLCTYSLLPPSMEALADVIFGAARAVGRLPAAIAGHYPRGHRWPA